MKKLVTLRTSETIWLLLYLIFIISVCSDTICDIYKFNANSWSEDYANKVQVKCTLIGIVQMLTGIIWQGTCCRNIQIITESILWWHCCVPCESGKKTFIISQYCYINKLKNVKELSQGVDLIILFLDHDI